MGGGRLLLRVLPLEPFLASPNQRRRCPRRRIAWTQLHFCSAPFATREDDDDDNDDDDDDDDDEEEEVDDDKDVGLDVPSRRGSPGEEAADSAGIEKWALYWTALGRPSREDMMPGGTLPPMSSVLRRNMCGADVRARLDGGRRPRSSPANTTNSRPL